PELTPYSCRRSQRFQCRPSAVRPLGVSSRYDFIPWDHLPLETAPAYRVCELSLSRRLQSLYGTLILVGMSEVTRLLSAIIQGHPQASDQLLPLVYDELRRLAAQKMAREGPGQTLEATALVHEAYLRLVDTEEAQQWNSRGHFFAAAAEAMRRILIERARHKQSLKAGGRRRRKDLADIALAAAPGPAIDLLALNEALEKLEKLDRRKAGLVKLRYFAGLTIEQAAQALGVSTSTADDDWAHARCWLRLEMKGGEE